MALCTLTGKMPLSLKIQKTAKIGKAFRLGKLVEEFYPYMFQLQTASDSIIKDIIIIIGL